MPTILEMHTEEDLIEKWVKYGTLDSEITYYLYHALKNLMLMLPIEFENMRNIFDLY